MKKEVITDSSQMTSKLQDTWAHLSFQGWPVSTKTEFSYQQASGFSKDSVMFYLNAYTDKGASYWSIPPRLTKAAKKMVCQGDEFFKTFGTHYVVGEKRGTVLNVQVNAITSNKASVAGLEAQWERYGTEAGSGAAFKQSLQAAGELSHRNVRVTASGMDSKFNLNPSLNDLDAIIDSYNKRSNQGIPVISVLRSYQSHPDFLAAKQKCSTQLEVVPGYDGLRDKLASVAVQSRLFYEEVLHRTPNVCARSLADKAKKLYTRLLNFERTHDMNKVVVKKLEEELKGLTKNWCSVKNLCMSELKNDPKMCAADFEILVGRGGVDRLHHCSAGSGSWACPTCSQPMWRGKTA